MKSAHHRLLPLLACVALISAACIPSLHSIYTEQDLVYDKELIGLWKDQDGEESWNFKPGEDRSYNLVYTDNDGKSGPFIAHLAKLDGHLFMDLLPENIESQSNDFYRTHLWPMHTFMHIQRNGDQLTLKVMDYQWIEDLLEREPGALSHETLHDRLLLTAQTKELQAFLIKHATDSDAWGDPARLHRVQP